MVYGHIDFNFSSYEPEAVGELIVLTAFFDIVRRRKSSTFSDDTSEIAGPIETKFHLKSA